MHVFPNLVPLDHKARPMAAKHRIRRVVQIPLRVVSDSLYDLLLVVAGQVPCRDAGQLPPAPRVGGDLHGVALKARHRRDTGQKGGLPPRVSGGSASPAIRWMSDMARPRDSAGISSRNRYQGSKRTLSVLISPWRTAR